MFTPLCWLSAILVLLANVIHASLYAPPSNSPFYGVIAFRLIAPLVLGTRRSPVDRFFASPALVLGGLASCGVYLWHYNLLGKIAGIMPGSGWLLYVDTGIVLLAVSFVIGYASHVLVERPVLSWVRRRVRPR